MSNDYADVIKNFINRFYDIVHDLDLCFDSGSMVFDGAIQFQNHNLYDLFEKFKKGKEMPFFVKTHQQFTELKDSVIYEYNYGNPILENAKCKDKNGIKKIQKKRVIKFYPFTQYKEKFVFVKLETTPSLSLEHLEHFKKKAFNKAEKAINNVKSLLQPTQSPPPPPPTFAENCGMFQSECKRHLNTLNNRNNNLLKKLKKDNDYNGKRPYKIQNILNAIFIIEYYESKILEIFGYVKNTITGPLEPMVKTFTSVPLKPVLNTFTLSNEDFKKIKRKIPNFAKEIGNIYGDELYISNEFWKLAEANMQTKSINMQTKSINTRLIKKKSMKRNDKKVKLYKGKYGGIYTIRKSKVSGKYYKYYMT